MTYVKSCSNVPERLRMMLQIPTATIETWE
jgi:hypothetical protein